MYKHLEENIIEQEFHGKKMNMSLIEDLCTNNGPETGNPFCTEYYYSNSDYYDDNDMIEQFKISERLIEKWFNDGIDFTLYFTIKDSLFQTLEIYKEVEEDNGHYCSSLRNCNDPTQEELRLTRRILNFFQMKGNR